MADPYIAHIRNNATGEVRQHTGHCAWEPDLEFLWSDGNWACDCNRGLFWGRAGGEPDPDRACRDDAFDVWIEQDGVIVYDEREEGNG